MKEREDLYYKLGKIAALVLIVLLIVYFLWGQKVFEYLPACRFRALTGLLCPGCGGTRAMIWLLKGHFLKSFYFHPGVTCGALLYGSFMMIKCVWLHFQKWSQKVFYLEYFIYVFLGILILQWIVKLIAQIVFHVIWI